VPLDYEVTVLRIEPDGRVSWKSTTTINEAILTLLQFARKNPRSQCRIELRHVTVDVASTDIASANRARRLLAPPSDPEAGA
jgi:hypothetical protein